VTEGIQVPLELDDFEVVSSELVDGVLEVHVRSTFPTACFHCGSIDVVSHGRHPRRLHDRPCGYPTVLIWDQQRVRCRDCGRTSRQRHPEVPGRRATTGRFRRLLFEQACRRNFTDVAADNAVSHYRVVEAFDAHAPAALPPMRHAGVLAMDESSFRRPFGFVTVLFDPLGRVALEMRPGRDQRAATELLWSLPSDAKAQVRAVVIDCHWPFRKAINEVLPDATVIADRFHVVRAIDTAAQKVRVRHGRKPRTERISRDGGTSRQQNPANDPTVYRLRFAFQKRARALRDDERVALAELFTRAPEAGAAYWMKEAFSSIYDSPNRAEAARRLAVWEHNLAGAPPELKATWRTLQWWRDEILNFFPDHHTNAFAEGSTNKIKVLKRAAYGMRNPHRYRHRVLLACDSRRT
jgi:transposase